MPLPRVTNANESPEPTPESPETSESEIDLPALAKKVYELLKEEARLECERTGRHQTW